MNKKEAREFTGVVIGGFIVALAVASNPVVFLFVGVASFIALTIWAWWPEK